MVRKRSTMETDNTINTVKDSNKVWEFNNIKLGYALHLYDKLHDVKTAKSEDEKVRLHMGLKGDYEFHYKQLNKRYDLAGGHHNIMYSKGIELEVNNKSLAIETLGIAFPKELFISFTQDADDLLKQFSEHILEGKNVIISEEWGTISSPIQQVVDDIISNPYSGSLESIFLLAKTLELLVLCVHNYKKSNEYQYHYLKTKTDKEAIIAARDFINERLDNPPNLTEIARHVGLNEFKLKYGFKEMFKSTIFGYLTDRRLNLANNYLKNTDKTLAQIAYDLGYSSPQHFSNQFRKKFGVTPKSVQKST